jgi:hypothetical protein
LYDAQGATKLKVSILKIVFRLERETATKRERERKRKRERERDRNEWWHTNSEAEQDCSIM